MIGTIKIDLREALKLGEFAPLPTPEKLPPEAVSGPVDPDRGMSGSSQGKEFAFSADFRTLDWGDEVFFFTPTQALIIEGLYHQWREGVSYTSGGWLLTNCVESNARKISDIFRDSPAWNKVIIRTMVPGASPDMYRLFCVEPKKIRRKGES